MRSKAMWALTGVGLLGLLVSGCVVTTTSVRVSSGFRPAYYGGHPVYFDSRINPYYCDHARRVRLPSRDRSRYVTFYYNHKSAYYSWASNHPPSCHGGAGAAGVHTHSRPKAHPRPSHRRR